MYLFNISLQLMDILLSFSLVNLIDFKKNTKKKSC